MTDKEVHTPGQPVSPQVPDIVWDLGGYPCNAKYPADTGKYGTRHHGYASEAQEALFYDFAVQRYDIRFRYKGKWYYLGSFGDHVAVTDERFSQEYETFPHANVLLENFKIDGRPLIALLEQLDEVETM